MPRGIRRAPAPKNLPVTRYLNRLIVESLGCPDEGPDEQHLTAAALAMTTLRELQLPIDDERVVEKSLRRENPYKTDFLAIAESTVSIPVPSVQPKSGRRSAQHRNPVAK